MSGACHVLARISELVAININSQTISRKWAVLDLEDGRPVTRDGGISLLADVNGLPSNDDELAAINLGAEGRTAACLGVALEKEGRR